MNFSPITPELFIGTTPEVEDYPRLRDLGVRLVINMRAERRPFPDPNTPPLSLLWLPTYDNPLFLIPIRMLHRGVHAALETIQNGGKVYAHCANGRHRGVAMGAAILIALGYDPLEAMDLIKDRRTISDPFVFYIRSRILRFARQWVSML
jgi:protein-tyrosine phosphatase